MNAKNIWNAANQEKRQEIAEAAGCTMQNFHSWDCLNSWERKRICFSVEGCEIPEEERHHDDHVATYCPEDNKIRLYVGRVSRECFNLLRKCGFKSTPKQDCDFVATWSVRGVDVALALIPEWAEIEDEDYSPQERAADRAERFAGYQSKRQAEAQGFADTYESGPSAFGHQNAKKAQRAAAKHERIGDNAVTQWGKAEYWNSRTAGVIKNALYLSSASVRRGRLLTIEKDERKARKDLDASIQRYETMLEVSESPEAEALIQFEGFNPVSWFPIQRKFYEVAADGRYSGSFWHPDSEEANAKCRELHNGSFKFSMWDLTQKEEYQGAPFRKMSPREVAKLYIETYQDPRDETTGTQRYLKHLELRKAYELQMIGDDGGLASELEMVPGGWIAADRRTCAVIQGGWAQIQKVNKSPATKRVTSVGVLGYRWYDDKRDADNPPYVICVKVDRVGTNCYRAPTPEELEEFNAQKKKAKARAKTKPKGPSLINPTPEDAQKLQDIMNEAIRVRFEDHIAKGKAYQQPKPSEIKLMTQKEYSSFSKGGYSHYKTHGVVESGVLFFQPMGGRANGTEVFKIRKTYAGGGNINSANRVIVITDKKQHPVPWEEMQRIQDEKAKAAEQLETVTA